MRYFSAFLFSSAATPKRRQPISFAFHFVSQPTVIAFYILVNHFDISFQISQQTHADYDVRPFLLRIAQMGAQ